MVEESEDDLERLLAPPILWSRIDLLLKLGHRSSRKSHGDANGTNQRRRAASKRSFTRPDAAQHRY